MSFFEKERDDFWDIEKLVPKKKNTLSTFSLSAKVSDYEISGEASDRAEQCKLTPSNYEASGTQEHIEYSHFDNNLIKRVLIKKVIDKYDFYENFRKAALVYYDFKTSKCDFAKYYSYMPQYSQLTSEQKKYYFYWRDEIRQGRYIKSDYSYLYLYVYEILNLPDKVLPCDGIVVLCNLWKQYRRELPKIDAYFATWVQDYCLVHNLSLPMHLLRDFIYEVISVTDFPEFYLSDFETAGVLGAETMLLYLSDYDWRRGKFASGDNAELYRRHMIGAMAMLFDNIFANGVHLKSEKISVISRSAFPHSLCTHAVKCRLEIEYLPLSKDDKLRSFVTEAVRYTENKLRSIIGVKSRLSIKTLPNEYAKIIDSYFEPVIKREKEKKIVIERPDYESLYDAPKEALSFSGADKLESSSWSITARLIAEEVKEELKEEIVETEPSCDEQTRSEDFGLSSDDIVALKSVIENGTRDESFAERINEIFVDSFGDIILEFNGDNYVVIEDYREEIVEWLTETQK